jgi:hypothetical protein
MERYASVQIDGVTEVTMPRYFFKLIDEGRVFEDMEGVECPDDEAARHEAAVTLSEVARDVLAADGLLHEFEMVVTNDEGGTVWRTHLDFSAEAGGAHG